MSEPVVIDLSNYKDRVGSRVAPGRYRVRVEDVEAAKSNNGNPMINIWFNIVGGDNDGQTIVDRLTITEKSLFRVVGFMQAIGLPTPKKRLQVNPRQFVGKTLDIDVEDGEPYNGRVKSEVRGYVRVAGTAKPVEEDEEFGDVDEPEVEQATTGAADPEASPIEKAPEKAEAAPAKAAPAPAADADDASEPVDLDEIEL